jgi:CubicO group peptidase (beta-lactamase class C family)
MKIYSLPFLFWLMLSPFVSWSQTKQEQKIDSLFINWKVKDSPGGVVAVLQDENIIYKKAFGLADIEKKIKNSPELKYDLASIAKQFTAFCIALLDEQGNLSVEDDLRKYYPEFQYPEGIKIKNLLDHTSGIREAYVLAMLSGKMNLKGEVPKKYNTKEFLLKVLSKEKDLNFKTGDELAYTNINYILLGDLVERVSKKPLHVFADSAIFKPLGMSNTVFRYKQKMEIDNEASGYYQKKKTFKKGKAFGGIVGDHNLLSTIDDLIKWERNFYNNQLGKRNQQLIDSIYTSSKLNTGELTQYAYGLWANEYRGLKQISHGGDDGRFTSFIIKFPEKQLDIIILSNSSRYDDTESKAYGIANILLKVFLVKPIETSERSEFIFPTVEELKPKSGLYTRVTKNGLAQLRKVSLADSSLYISAGYYGKGIKLSATTQNHFMTTLGNGKLIQFQFENDSAQLVLKEIFGEKIGYFKKMKEFKPVFTDFLGSYVNESTGAKLKVKKKKNGVVARKGIIKFPIMVFDRDQFYAYEHDALFIFERDASGKVIRLKANARDFRNFIFTRQPH